MKTLKVLLQEVVSGIKAWVNSNFAQESNAVHKTGNETVNGVKTFSDGVIGMGTLGTKFTFSKNTTTNYEMTASDFTNKVGFFKVSTFKADSTSAPRGNTGDYDIISMSYNTPYSTYLCASPRNDILWYGKFWDSVWQGWKEVVNCESSQTLTGEKTFTNERISFRHPTYVRGTTPSSPAYLSFTFGDSQVATTARLLRYVNTDGSNALTYQVWNTQVTTDTYGTFSLGFDTQGSCFAQFRVDDVKPVNDNSVNLGTSERRWKTFNGLNPGALSLPDYANAVSIDTTSWSKTGSMIVYTPLISGWLQLTIPGDVGNLLAILDSGTSPLSGQEFDGSGSTRLYLTYPVIANRTYWIYISASSIITARLVPCLGNV